MGESLLSEPLFDALELAALLAVVRAVRSPDRRWALAAGAIGGTLTLTRANGVMVLVALAAGVWAARRDQQDDGPRPTRRAGPRPPPLPNRTCRDACAASLLRYVRHHPAYPLKVAAYNGLRLLDLGGLSRARFTARTAGIGSLAPTPGSSASGCWRCSPWPARSRAARGPSPGACGWPAHCCWPASCS